MTEEEDDAEDPEEASKVFETLERIMRVGDCVGGYCYTFPIAFKH